MKSLTFNRSSWHYRIADAGGYYPQSDEDGNDVGDICEYTQAILKACVAGLIAAAIFAGISFLLVHLILGLAFSWIYGAWLMTPYGEATLILAGSGCLVGTVVYCISKFVDWNQRRKWINEDKPDGFVKHAYKSWKEKYCARIIFKG